MQLSPLFRSLVATLVASSAVVAFAADDSKSADRSRDLLGRARITATFDHYWLQDAAPFESTASGQTITLAVPVASWLDLGLEHGTARVDGPLSLELERRLTLASATLHGGTWGRARPYFTFAYGRMSQTVTTKTPSRAWEFEFGAEIPLGGNLVLTPAIENLAASSLELREWRLGLALDWRFARHWSATARVRQALARHDSDYRQASFGLSFVY